MEWRNGMRPRWLLVVAVLVVGLGSAWLPFSGRAQGDAGPGSAVQVVHAAPDLGVVDVYVDGRLALLGLRFGDNADPIALSPGEHVVALVFAGDTLADGVAETRVSVPAGDTELAILGGGDTLSFAVLPLDLIPLPPTSARLRFVNGATGFGPADLALTGGDVLFPPVDLGAATDFADLVAGAYDLEVRYGGTEVVALPLPGFTMDPERVYTLYLVGDATVGTVQTMLSSRPTAVPDLTGVPATIRRGSCVDAVESEVVADLNTVSISPFGEPVGYPDVTPIGSSFTSIAVPLADLLEPTHSLVVAAAPDDPVSIIGCGEIGGRQALDGSLVIEVRLRDGATAPGAGVAVLAPNVLDPGLTDISVFLSLPSVGREGEAAEPAPAESPDATPIAAD